MRSQLTRSVFLRLLSNKPLVFRCSTRFSLRLTPRYGMQRTSAKRSLFGFSRKPPREPRAPELAPGLSKMLDLNKMLKIGARPPPASQISQAFRSYFAYKDHNKTGLNELQAGHVLRTFEYLQKFNSEEEGFGLPNEVLRCALVNIAILPTGNGETHSRFARAVFQELRERKAKALHIDLKYLVTVLVHTGNTAEAMSLVEEFLATSYVLEKDTRKENLAKAKRNLFSLVMKGYARENNESELLKVAERVEAAGLGPGSLSHETMTSFYASRDDVPNTKIWFDRNPHARSPTTSKELMSTILSFSIRNQELDWCKAVFRRILDKNPPKPAWDVLFQWASGALGKGVEDVDRMIDFMIKHNPEDESVRPDAETINGLVELAMSAQDSYLAERYVALGKKYGIQPNAQTFILQLNYRVSAGDLAGAQTAYDALQSEEVENHADLPAINKYIRALCSLKVNHYERAVSICSDLDERNIRLEPDTVSAMCLLHLSRGEMNDVLDMLQTNTFHYTLPERARIIETFVAFCSDRKTNTSDAWEAYNMLRTVFQEMPVNIRTTMMNEFFARKRSDMACHVFGHMRQHDRKEFRPVLQTYIDCFRGIALCKDKECLDMVHNMFKMDSSIEPNTKLYNSLMMAYTACEEGDRALDFWHDITNSREGPSYESLELVFKACQEQSFGDRTAKEVWAKMRRMEIEVTREVFIAYVCALAGQGRMEESKELVETAEKDLGLKPDVLTIGSFYNALPGQNRKDLVEEWAKDLYPDIWAELEKLGQRTMKEGHRLFNMKKLASD
ncbi:complex I intermediate-associated [Hyphodiscus hymeniophilus]|uniref:Complex I intermediate-associated n=1 Tax=Hyphodiscus hymeniophilus TaxID=353542 RepID=A0A9P6VPL2_9HELO|nr:complex I intermediate-associated [Hyphodiscus hymeniophilus]